MRRDKRLRLTTVEDASAAAIHKAVLRVLWEVGAAIDEAEVRAWLIGDHGCRESDDGRLRFPPELVERALETVPPRVTLFDRDGALRVDTGERRRRSVVAYKKVLSRCHPIIEQVRRRLGI